jgi:hypothetical protein
MIFKFRSKLVLLVLILAAIIFLPLLAHAQTFQYGKTITIDHTKVSDALTNFPVLVSISNDNDLVVYGWNELFGRDKGGPTSQERTGKITENYKTR